MCCFLAKRDDFKNVQWKFGNNIGVFRYFSCFNYFYCYRVFFLNKLNSNGGYFLVRGGDKKCENIRIKIDPKLWDLIRTILVRKMVKIGKYKNENWFKFWVLILKKRENVRIKIGLNFLWLNLCLSWIALFYTTRFIYYKFCYDKSTLKELRLLIKILGVKLWISYLECPRNVGDRPQIITPNIGRSWENYNSSYHRIKDKHGY